MIGASDAKVFSRKVGEGFKKIFLDDTPPSIAVNKVGKASKIKSIGQEASHHSFASLLPYESYDADTELFFNRDTVGFVLACLPATGLSTNDLTILNGLFSMQHKPNTSIQVSLYSDPNIEPILDKWKNFGSLPDDHKFKPMLDMIADERLSYLKQGKWQSLFTDEPALLKDLHLIISYTIPVATGVAPVDIPAEDIEFLKRTKSGFIGTLRSVSIHAKAMSPERLINIMDGMLNPSDDGKAALRYDENNLINTQCVDSDTVALWGAGVSSIVHNKKAISLTPFHVRQYPKQWAGFLNGEFMGSFKSANVRHSCPFLMTLTVNVPEQSGEKNYVMKKQMRATQMAKSAVASFAPQWFTRKADWNYAATKVDEGNKFVESFFQIILFSPEGKEQENERSMVGIFKNSGWDLSRSRYTPVHSFLGAIPMGVCQDTYAALKLFGHYNKTLSWTCTNLAPFIGEFKGTPTPLLLLPNLRGQISYFDNFDNKAGNYNISCTAASGGGKSFLTQDLVIRTIQDNGRVFIIDAGHSYRNINNLLDGTYIDFGTGAPKFNPFSTIKEDDPRYIREQIPLLKLLFEQMVSPSGVLDQAYRATLEKAIMLAWSCQGSKAEVDTVLEKLALDKNEKGGMTSEAVFLIKALFSYSSEGVYGDYFTGSSNVDLTSNFVVLELDALNNTPDLQSVVLLILMMQITQVMYLSGNKTQRKLCIIDEAWRLLGRGNAGDFIEEGYRVARKHGGCFMTITQKVSDYFSSPTAQAAYMNSDISIYLRQKAEELKQAETLGYIDNSDGKIDILKSLKTEHGKYSEMAISSPGGMAVYRFYVGKFAAKLYSTTAKDVDFIMNEQARGVSILEAVKKLVREEAA